MMPFAEASQIPVVLVRDCLTVNSGCAVCDGPLIGTSYILWTINLHQDNIYIPFHKACARANGFGTDPDRVHVGEVSEV
jgi:hypothetical protein